MGNDSKKVRGRIAAGAAVLCVIGFTQPGLAAVGVDPPVEAHELFSGWDIHGSATAAPATEAELFELTEQQQPAEQGLAPVAPDAIRVYREGRHYVESPQQELRRFDTSSASFKHCPRFAADKPGVYGIGSSTMAWQLGPQMKDELKSWGINAWRWGKHSSGLSRPDYWDWPKQLKKMLRKNKYDIDVFVVSLGTNDGQGLKQRRGYIRFWRDPEGWRKGYGERVDQMLELLSGKDRKRAVIWIGPTAFRGKNAARYQPVINEVLRERIEAFDGPAHYIDVYARTRVRAKAFVDFIREPGAEDATDARGHDGVHLTEKGVQWLMSKALFDVLRPCVHPRSAPHGRWAVHEPPPTPAEASSAPAPGSSEPTVASDG